MLAMQAQENISAVFDTHVGQKARKCIGSRCASAQIATERKHLDGFSAPIGGATGLAGNYPVIWTIQIIPCRMQVFRGSISSLFRKTDRDPSTGGDPLFLVDVNTHIDDW